MSLELDEGNTLAEVTECVMRKKGKGENWERQTDMTIASSRFGIPRFPFSSFPIFPLLTPHFRWLNSYAWEQNQRPRNRKFSTPQDCPLPESGSYSSAAPKSGSGSLGRWARFHCLRTAMAARYNPP